MVTAEANATRVDHLHLRNFRLFGDLEIHFHPKLTVLVADNGGGKTAILDALAIALDAFVAPLEGRLSARGISRIGDIRRFVVDGRMESSTATHINARGSLAGTALEWGRTLVHKKGARTLTLSAGEPPGSLAMRIIADMEAYAHRAILTEPELPLFAYYGTGRLWNVGRLSGPKTHRDPTPNARVRGYTDCLSAGSHYKFFAEWFVRMSFQVGKHSDFSSRVTLPGMHLTTVERAVDAVLEHSGWQRLEWEFDEEKIVARHAKHGRLPVDSLSDGIRTMIGLAADIAHRSARLNPDPVRELPSGPAGIVLIDEIDMHLHPSWQQLVIGSLLSAFPRLQFVVTTHSPQVISTVPRECIRILDELDRGAWRARPPSGQTQGVESAYVLADVMGVDPLPEVAAVADLKKYQAMLDAAEADTIEGSALYERLVAHYGRASQTIEDLEKVRRFLAFKAQRASNGGRGA